MKSHFLVLVGKDQPKLEFERMKILPSQQKVSEFCLEYPEKTCWILQVIRAGVANHKGEFILKPFQE